MSDICLVTADSEGEARAVAARLGRAGHRVTVLVTGEAEGAPPRPTVATDGDGSPERVIHCPTVGPRMSGHPIVVRAYHAWQWCKGRSFDVICFAERGGAGYFISMARRLGLDFHGTALVACCEGPTLWRLAGNGRLPSGDDLAADHLERSSVAWADMAVCPTSGMLEWMHDEAWAMPGITRVVPPPPTAAPGPGDTVTDAMGNLVAVRELVVVGPLERRSGLITFTQALGRLPAALTRDLRVTFVGQALPDPLAWQPQPWLDAAMPPGTSWRIEDGPDAARLSDDLNAPGRLALALGVTEQLPAIVAGCLSRRVPFLACDTPETRALVHPDDRAAALCLPSLPAVADALAMALSSGVRPARPARTTASEDPWPGLVADAVARRARVGHTPWLPPSTDGPLVTVVVTHRNRPRLLGQAVEGLRRQTFSDFEVVLVDDGSDTTEARSALDALEPEFASRGWRIIRQSNQYLGAARNRGWRAARAPLVLFHDDDNIAMPRQIERLVSAARYSGAAIITSALALLEGDGPPDGETPGLGTVVTPFLGGALALGLFENGFGDAQALVRRDVLESLGGFTEDFGVGHEDWELFARAALAGHEVLSMPEPLFWYRVSSGSMLRTRPDVEPDLCRCARAYTEMLPPVLRPMLLAALGFASRMDAVQQVAADERSRRIEAEERLEEARLELARARATAAEEEEIG